MKCRRFCLLLLAAPYLAYGLGVLCNLAVVTANSGVMPVHYPTTWVAVCDAEMVCRDIVPGAMMDHIHRVMQPSDHLKFLADWIQEYWAARVISIGDCFLALERWLTPWNLYATLAVMLHEGMRKE